MDSFNCNFTKIKEKSIRFPFPSEAEHLAIEADFTTTAITVGLKPSEIQSQFLSFLSCKGQESLFSDLLEIRNNFSKIEWKKEHFFSKFYIQNRQFQGIKKLGDLATPQGFWKYLGVAKTQTNNCEKFVYCKTSHKGMADH